MTEAPSTHPLTQRLVVERLAAPGILDRQRLQRAHDRFSHPPSTQMLGRLHRRIASAVPSPENLPLVRVDRSVEPATSPTNPVETAFISPNNVQLAATSVRGAAADRGSTGATASPTNIAGPVVGAMVTRQAPGLTRASEFVARRVGAQAGLVGSSRTIARLIDRSSGMASSVAPSISRSAFATGVVQRVVENRDAPRVGAAGELASAAIGTSPTVVVEASYMATRASSVAPVMPPVPRGTNPSFDVPRGPAMTTALPRASAPLMWRKPEATAQIKAASGPAAPTASPAITAVSTPLLLRKADAAVSASQPAIQTPSIATSATAVVARKASTVEPAASERAPTSTGSIDIDWIAEQVGNRLARRLEIERERLGVRQWRQVS